MVYRTAEGSCVDVPYALQIQMETKCVVDLGQQGCLQQPQRWPHPLDRDGTDLLGLGLGRHAQTNSVGGNQHLEWEYPRGVTGQGHHGDNAATQPLSDGISPIVAHHHRGTLLVGLIASDRIQVDQPNLSSAHQDNPSDAVVSHFSRSPDRSQSSQAAA